MPFDLHFPSSDANYQDSDQVITIVFNLISKFTSVMFKSYCKK